MYKYSYRVSMADGATWPIGADGFYVDNSGFVIFHVDGDPTDVFLMPQSVVRFD
jgi:hypothetical protein